MKKRLFLITLCLILAMLFAGCGAGTKGYDVGSEDSPKGEDGTINNPAILVNTAVNRKIYYTVNTQIETKDFDKTIQDIVANLDVTNGEWQERFEVTNAGDYQYAEITVRIKTERLQEFMDEFKNFGKIVSLHSYSTDVTEQYADFSATKTAYEQEIELLQKIIDENTDLESSEVVTYVSRIAELNRQINSIQTELNKYDSLIDYSVVNLRIYENGLNIVEETYGEEVGNAFFGTWKFLGEIVKFVGLALVAISPIALIGGVAFGIVYLCIRHSKKKRAELEKEMAEKAITEKETAKKDSEQ